MAELCSHPVTDQEAAERLFVFTRLQDTFECNGMCYYTHGLWRHHSCSRLHRNVVPSRILQWMKLAQKRLEEVTSSTKPSSEYREWMTQGWRPHCAHNVSRQDDRKREIATISGQLVQALSIMQGVALTHKGSKRFLGRQYALQVRHTVQLHGRPSNRL